MKILNKYTFREIIGPFFFGLFAFTSMFMGFILIDLMRQTEQLSFSMINILYLVALRFPEYVMQASPIAVLLAVLLGLGNLTGHSETIAMRAGGMSYYQLALPVIVLGLVISISGTLMNEYVVPQALRTYTKMKGEVFRNQKSSEIYNFSYDFKDHNNKMKKRIYAVKFIPHLQEMHQVTIEEFEEGVLNRIILTSTMYWDGSGWYFRNGNIFQLNSDNFVPIKVEEGYMKYDLDVTPKEIKSLNDEPDRQSISELYNYIKKFHPTPSKERRQLLVELHMKFSVPFASLIFAVLGTPLALRPQRRSNAAGFGLCIIFILLWYVLMAVGNYLSLNHDILPPLIGAWLPNIVLAGYGINVYMKVKC
ncbi:MAG TPA: LptF/LptG family permease [Bacillota bacterium]|jgi:lipopolysaccharide export system permease protein|nr:LptF/LptG family permease [Bacillota bacterium]HOL10565.1 LptF/LptG family permease [Bacillota bacterium]HPO98319.1 LptF/LptG family permease [Bacillota bacterium]